MVLRIDFGICERFVQYFSNNSKNEWNLDAVSKNYLAYFISFLKVSEKKSGYQYSIYFFYRLKKKRKKSCNVLLLENIQFPKKYVCLQNFDWLKKCSNMEESWCKYHIILVIN